MLPRKKDVGQGFSPKISPSTAGEPVSIQYRRYDMWSTFSLNNKSLLACLVHPKAVSSFSSVHDPREGTKIKPSDHNFRYGPRTPLVVPIKVSRGGNTPFALSLQTLRVFRAARAASKAGIASARSLSHSSFRAWASAAFSLATASSWRTSPLLASTSLDSFSITCPQWHPAFYTSFGIITMHPWGSTGNMCKHDAKRTASTGFLSNSPIVYGNPNSVRYFFSGTAYTHTLGNLVHKVFFFPEDLWFSLRTYIQTTKL